jgi:predicted nucleotidyltransferase
MKILSLFSGSFIEIPPFSCYVSFVSSILHVDEIKSKVSQIAKQYGVGKVYLFGSYARGEAGPESDIDICIEKGKIRTLLDLSGFSQDLEDSLQNKVDIVTTTALNGAFKKNLEKERVLIYG